MTGCLPPKAHQAPGEGQRLVQRRPLRLEVPVLAGVYVPVFATSGTGALVVYVTVFLVLVAVRWLLLCPAAGGRPRAAPLGHIVLPVVLIGIGMVILIEGGAFG